MTIRRQLTLLVAAVALPVIALAAVATARLWTLQREAHEQRYLERVVSVRLALEARFDAAMRLLAGFEDAAKPAFDSATPRDLVERLVWQRLRAHPEWAGLGIVDAAGRTLSAASRSGEPPMPPPPTAFLRGVSTPTVSPLIRHADGHRVAYVVLPVEAAAPGGPRGWLYVGETATGWLEFLRRYPIGPDTTLTLNDGAGAIVARTLNHERWVGQRSSEAFLGRIAGRAEGVFEILGLEGQRFYTAFSRSRGTGWTVGTGVPSQTVEAALRQSTAGIAAGIAFTAVLVVLLAAGIGSRVIRAMSGLERVASAVGQPGAESAVSSAPLPVADAETVRQALLRADRMIASRDAERASAFAREAAARADAEAASAGKDEFIAMLGHELRNPLSALKSAAALLAMPNVAPAVEARAHDIVGRQIRRLTGLVDDMLDVARLDSGKVVLDRRPVDLARIAEHVLAAFATSGRCHHLTIDASLQSARVEGDEMRLEQVVANLLDNACKYTPAGGTVRVATSADGDRARIVVADDGSGIASDLLPRVFDVFAQGKRTLERAEGGLGLGLTVVHRLTALHGGRVHAASEGIGRGATFTVEMAALAAPVAATADEAAAAGAGLRLVVVEDDDDNRDLYRLLLEDEGHTVVLAADGVAGVAAIVAESPDAAIVDIGLPGIDGFEVARRVRASASSVFLVAVTGYGTPADRERALQAGFDAFLRKPFDRAAFEAIVAEASSPKSKTPSRRAGASADPPEA